MLVRAILCMVKIAKVKLAANNPRQIAVASAAAASAATEHNQQKQQRHRRQTDVK